MDKTSLQNLEIDELISTKTVCQILGISLSYFYKKYKNIEGFPRPYKLNPNEFRSHNKFKKSEIIAWMESRRVTA